MKTYVLNKPADSTGPKTDYAAELNAEQLKVVTEGDGPCLVLAGAGSGKTRTIVYRVAYLLEHGVPPERVLLLTFTNKAAREMLGRVEALSGGSTRRLWGGTFHHVCHRILREAGELVGLKKGFTILDSEDAKDLMKVCVRECGVDPKARRFPSPAVLLSIVSFACNSRLTPAEVVEFKHPAFREMLTDIERVGERYLARKREANAVDFDDLLVLTLRLLREHEGVRRRYASQFRYVLVDEYQDTNHIQAEIVRQLSSEHGNVLVVGDDAQSIYSFRGADIRNILDFPKLFPGSKVFRLETNYRSTPEILDLANDIISRNSAQFPKELKAVRPSFAKPTVTTAASAAQEAEFVAQRILELRDEGVPMREIAVLFRATFHSQSLEFELMKRGIPYDYRGGLKFFDRAHVKDALAFLKLIANKDDVVAWMRALSLQVGIGSVTAEKIYERARTLPTPEDVCAIPAEELPGKAATGWRDFVSILRKMTASGRQPSGLLRALKDSGYAAYLERQFTDFRERLDDLEEMAEFAERYEALDEFLSDVTLRDDMSGRDRAGDGADPERDERIVLSTIHQAKGLEWEAVFLIHLARGQFPNKRAMIEEGGMEEERRLFYVAATRARRELYLCYPLVVGYDQFMAEPESEFLEEMDQSLVEQMKVEENYDDLPVIVVSEDGEKSRPRKSLLKDISEY